MTYLRLIATGLLVLLLIGVGWYLGARTWEARYNALKDRGLEGQLAAETMRADKMQEALHKEQAASAHNLQVNHDLLLQIENIRGTRDQLAGRLRWVLDHQNRSSGGRVSQDPGGQGGPAARPDSGDGRLDGLLADALTEAQGITARCNALRDKIAPQL